MIKRFLAAISLVTFFATANARAIVVDLIPQMVAAYDTAFTPIALPTSPNCCVGETILQFDFSILASDLQSNEAGFGWIAFDIDLSGAVVDAYNIGWNPDNFVIDSNGAAPGGMLPLWSINEDTGTPNDEIGILVAVASNITNPSDPRYSVAVGSPRYIGSMFVHFNGGDDVMRIENIRYQARSTSGGYLPSSINGNDLEIYIGAACPEPSTLITCSMILSGLAFRRRIA